MRRFWMPHRSILQNRNPDFVFQEANFMSFVPYVVEQTAHGERSYDIFSRLLGGAGPGQGHQPVYQQPRRLDQRRHGHPRHHAVYQVRRVHHLHGDGRLDGRIPAGQRHQGQALCSAQLRDPDPPAPDRRRAGGRPLGPGHRHQDPRGPHHLSAGKDQRPAQRVHRPAHRAGAPGHRAGQLYDRPKTLFAASAASIRTKSSG